MKKLLTIAVGTLLLQSAQAALLFYEPFATNAYANGAALGLGVGQWNRGSSPGTGSSIVTDTAPLSYSGLVTSNNSFGLLRPANSVNSNKHAGADLSSSQTISAGNPTVYCSFLLNVQTPTSGNRCIAALGTSTANNPSAAAGVWVSGSQLLVSKNSTAPGSGTTSGLTTGTHLVVFRYKYNGSSSDDEVALWLDPSAATFGTNETYVPPFDISTTANTDITTIPTVYAVQGQAAGGSGSVWGSGSGVVWMDEIRVGTTWADVTPVGELPPPPPPPTTNTPVITETLMTAEGLVLRGTNGNANSDYHVRATIDVSLPIEQWDFLGTYGFDSNGNFDCTNAVAPGVDRVFYRLQVGGSLPTAPQITGQPQSQVTIAGQNAAFSVVVEGAQPFSYQWYFNSDTILTGEAADTLTLNDVQTNKAGGYSVVVSNNLGSVTSVVAVLTVHPSPTNGSYYVATNGSDSNPGSIAAPFATLEKAISVALPGDIIYMRGGTYFPTQTIRIEKSGTASDPINIWAFPGEQPFLDFVGQPYGSNNRGILFTTNGNYWNVRGLEIARAGDNAIKVEGSHLRFEQCMLHHNGDTGLQIGFGHPAVNNINLAAFIEVINCDSYGNYDSDSNGGDADGFAAKLHCGQGIVFYGCRAWENSDDGWDLFETDASVIISNCWAWRSAPFGQGNGNGIKLGGDGAGGSSKGTHYAYNCVAFNCKVNGFTQNSHKDGLVVVNCLGFSNGNSGYNFYMEGSLNSGKQNVFKNNASIPRSGTNNGGFIADNNPVEVNNSWNLAVTVNSGDWSDITETAAKAPRQPDGSLPTGFARLVAGSDLIDKGVDVGIPFNGSSPDLGPMEYAP